MTSHSEKALPGVSPAARELFDGIVRVRRDLHRNPELGFQENRTASVIVGQLESIGLEVERMAGTGVVGLLRGEKPGKTLLIRADMDALPLQEENAVDYRSETASVMHACGHDGHVSTALAAARVLHAERGELAGNVKFMFQPAEEGPGGAEPMIQAGVLRNPEVDAAIGLHVWNNLPVGKVAVRPGPIMAAADEIHIAIQSKGGHGAAPHQTVDPVLVASHVVTALQSIVSRSVDPMSTAVVSICSIHAGKAFNIIPREVTLIGTVRTYDPRLRSRIQQRIEEIVAGVAGAFGARYVMEYRLGYPTTVNDEEMSAFVAECAESLPCVHEVVGNETSMGGEDMAYVLQNVPGCFFFLGTSNEERGINSPHHSPTFDIDEHALPIGVDLFCDVARKYLRG